MLVKSLVEWYAYMGIAFNLIVMKISLDSCEIPRCLFECLGHVEAMFVAIVCNLPTASNSFPNFWPVVTQDLCLRTVVYTI